MAKLSQKEKDNAINEVRILASINHPNVAGYKEAFFESSTSTLCIVMEFADGGDLQSKINTLKKTTSYMKESDVWSIFYQMVTGLNSLHKAKIVHRDIKCANVFLTKDGTVKLGDLNVSKIAKAGVMQTQTGTPYYASPEVWQDKPYDKSSDIWSLGAVLYEMTALNPPFTAKDMKGLFNKVIKGVYPKIPSFYSSDLSSMISNLLQVDPKKRPSTEQILHMPVFIAKYNEYNDEEQGGLDLLGTIHMPKNLNLLSERLPKAQYKSEKKEQAAQNHRSGSKLQSIKEEEDYKTAVPPSRQYNQMSDKKPPIRPRPIQRSDSAKLIEHQNYESHQDILIHNQLANKQSRIVANNKISSASRVPSGQESRRLKQNPSTNSLQKQSTQQQESPLKRRKIVQQDQQQVSGEAVINVKPYPKQQFNQIPGSCPPNRSSNQEEIVYQQKQGKAPLIIERQERLRRLQAVQNQMKPIEVLPDPFAVDLQQGVNPLNQAQEAYLKKLKEQRVIKQQVRQELERYQNVDNQLNDLNKDLISLNHYTPQYGGQQLIKPEQNYGMLRNQLPPSAQDLSEALGARRNKAVVQNQLRNRYAGVQQIVEQGRIESQRLLMERYKRIEVGENPKLPGSNRPNYYGQYNGGQQDIVRQYIPMSSKGPRPQQIYRQAQPQAQANWVKPSWWG